jgi:hypothetical protein
MLRADEGGGAGEGIIPRVSDLEGAAGGDGLAGDVGWKMDWGPGHVEMGMKLQAFWSGK